MAQSRARAGGDGVSRTLSQERVAELSVPTRHGLAVVTLDWPARRRPIALLALGHGAGGDVNAPDLAAVADAAARTGVVVARITQPYRVAGRRASPRASVLDEAWVDSVTAVRSRVASGTRLVVGGRSAGARVACRTARLLGAVAVVALAFPLHPPGRPEASRADELDPTIATLVVNGDRDPFGVPKPAGLVEVVIRPGERHDLRRDPAAVGDLVAAWLRGQLADRRSPVRDQ